MTRNKLYWVVTDDQAEDWFIVASSKSRAARAHEGYEGYARGDATATLVARIPRGIEAPEGWPSDELLEACGARILRNETPRVVEVGGKRYVEGYLEQEIRQLADDRFEERGQGRPNRTEPRRRH